MGDGRGCVKMQTGMSLYKAVTDACLDWGATVQRAFAFPPGRPSPRGFFGCDLVVLLPRRYCLRLLLLYACPPLCVGALWPLLVRVWREVQCSFLFLGFMACGVAGCA